MKSIAQNKEKIKRYLPHEISTKVHAVETYRQVGDVGYMPEVPDIKSVADAVEQAVRWHS